MLCGETYDDGVQVVRIRGPDRSGHHQYANIHSKRIVMIDYLEDWTRRRSPRRRMSEMTFHGRDGS